MNKKNKNNNLPGWAGTADVQKRKQMNMQTPSMFIKDNKMENGISKK